MTAEKMRRSRIHFACLVIVTLAGVCSPCPADADLPDIIFAQRKVFRDGHWYANFGYWVTDEKRKLSLNGGRLCRLNPKTGKVTVLLDDPKGSVRDPRVHYDAKKILFSYRKGGQDYFHLYEINVDGTRLRQLTRGSYDDLEPTYLPDGGIIFCSSRCNRWVNCYFTQVANLYRCDADGKNIRALSANIEHDNTPWVLPDGRVLYMRWEYIDRSQVAYHHLWTMNPDGTGQMIYYGNLRPSTVMLDAKPIPGTGKVVVSFSPGHGRTEHAGYITIVDPREGPDAPHRARRLSKGLWRDPYPLSNGRFLVANDTDICLMKANGQTVSLYSMPQQDRKAGMKLHEPRPLLKSLRERIIPPRVNLKKATGRVMVRNVHIGRNMKGVKPGEIKKLLVLEALAKPLNMFSGMEPLTYGGTFTLERVLGTVPVEKDGSAFMELPAMRSLFFVALDKNDMAVKRMQSFMTVQPGEQISCVGCHESRRDTAPPAGRPTAMLRAPSKIEPIAGVPSLYDFPRDIQPILDKHCVACHGYEKTAKGGPRSGGVILTGDRGPFYSHSYYMLTVSGQFSDGRNMRKSNYAPRTLGSAASPLLKRLDGSHNKVKLSAREKTAIRLWIETAAAYPGTYAALGTGMIGDHSRRIKHPKLNLGSPAFVAAKDVIKRRCASCHKGGSRLPLTPADNKGMVPWGEGAMNLLVKNQRGNPTFRFNRHILYNLTRPEKSLLLLAPLAKAAGGFVEMKQRGPTGKVVEVFKNTDDPDYQKLLLAVRESKGYLDGIKRFDMPGFKPGWEWVREMKRFGILPRSFDIARDPVDVYETEEKYWQSLWHHPPEHARSKQ